MAKVLFDEIKTRVSIVDVLSRYFESSDLELEDGKTQLRLPCPICSYNGRSFSASTTKNVFKCFHCPAQGNVLDLVASLEETDVPGAARLLSEWFPDPIGHQSKKKAKRTAAKKKKGVSEPASGKAPESLDADHEPQSPSSEIIPKTINTVLGFELKGIDPDHPDVIALGLTQPDDYGIGYYKGRGSLSNQIVCPIRNHDGDLLAYCSLAIEDGMHRITYPGVQHFARDADLYFPSPEGQQETNSMFLVQSPLQAVLLSERGFCAVAFMADLPGKQQIHVLYNRSTQHDVRITYCYALTDSDTHIGQVVRSLVDIDLTIAEMI